MEKSRFAHVASAVLTYVYVPVEHAVVYTSVVVPRLRSWQKIPLGWTAVEWGPLLVVLAILGSIAPPRWIVVHASIAAAVACAYGTTAAVHHWPAYGKSLAHSPAVYWTAGLILQALLFATPMFGAWAARRWLLPAIHRVFRPTT